MVIDGTFLELMPPMALFGDDTVDSSIVMPGMVTSFNSDTKLQPIRNGSNLTAGMNMLNKMEDSVSESSQAPRQMGQEGSGQKTAYEISQLEKNAKIGLGLAGRMIGFLVRDLGQLVVSDAIQYLTVGQVAELTTGDTMLKYRKFLLNGVDNEEFNEAEIQLDNDLPEEMSEEEDIQNGFKIMDEEGGIDSKKAIFKVNPTIFRNLKYKTYITAEMIEEPSDNVKRALNLEVYDRAIANPSIDSEAITKDLLLGSYPETKDRTDKYMRKPEDMESMMMQQQAGARPNNVVGSVANAERQVI
jgi:hypothetical protein